MIKIAFDIGGVISKYPTLFREFILSLRNTPSIKVYIISDIHPKEEILWLLRENNICVNTNNVYVADYDKYGDSAKSVLLNELNIDIMIDDHLPYIMSGGNVRLLVVPNVDEPYHADEWITKPGGSNFGRKVKNHIPRHKIISDMEQLIEAVPESHLSLRKCLMERLRMLK